MYLIFAGKEIVCFQLLTAKVRYPLVSSRLEPL